MQCYWMMHTACDRISDLEQQHMLTGTGGVTTKSLDNAWSNWCFDCCQVPTGATVVTNNEDDELFIN